LRTSLDILAVRLFIEKLDENAQLVPSLRNIAKQMGEAAGKENIVQTADLDLVFHQTICESSSNRYLIEAWMRISKLIRLCLITDLVFKNYGQTEQDHNLIIEAIAEKNSNLGEERIKSHTASSSTLLFGET
jgi:DNA-binding GntR family transcriptional regulator